MNRFPSDRYPSIHDSGVHVLEPEDQALLRACVDRATQDEQEAAEHRRFLKIARELPAVRLQKVMKIRKEIASGRYLTEGKLKATVDRILGMLS